MAEQICPKCKQEAFNWTYDEDHTPHTFWKCGNCKYEAYEDESMERPCKDCGSKTESRLEDEQIKYWWCSRCNKVTIINN
jgi:hypothetical protein